ncbi:MAG: SDR family NAD(P)-dependent oxidoreductase [Deltaproteobacteria bacterium]|nr:SDR family NAD(P)-dependent oxidoreductase [Deltaproteobacteria bacterium]MBW2399162.1 SDR family NAD(P)-dependent oxidoreductase [Deltaproteobacteria bacterium]MBW2665820.1 SDR family NAD(P)-dependent oxidoreductase [Deltaproteobacteria bacterium]
MSKSLVFVSGASSGIGLALVRAQPFDDARTIDISRRGGAGCEHFAADLADPAEWRRVDELFDREIPGFAGERVIFIHSAGTLEPIGYAGEVDAGEYLRNVLLNSAAPQVLGDAFLRAVAKGNTNAWLIFISSGAASSVYEGWTSYGAGKAAVDQWVRAAGAEQDRRGGGCRVLSVAPGVVATEMQEQIRAMPTSAFPEVGKFVALHQSGELRDPAIVAGDLWALLDGGHANGAVLDLRDPEE